MAIDCNDIANIVSLGLISGDDDLAKRLADLSEKKKSSFAKIKNTTGAEGEIDELTGLSANELELKAASADIEMRAIVQAKVLDGSLKSAEAYEELAKQIYDTHSAIAGGIEALEQIRKAPMTDYEEIARLWGGQDPSKVIQEINEKIANFTASAYSIRQYSDTATREFKRIKDRVKKHELTWTDAEKEIELAFNNALDKIKNGDNPAGLIKLDKEWHAIKRIAGKDADKAGKLWTQYVMAKEFLSEGLLDDSILKVFSRVRNLSNFTGPLTVDKISKFGPNDLDKLLARAYTNTEQLYTDRIIRDAYRQKLIEITSGGLLNESDMRKINTIINTINMTEQGVTFSKTLRYSTVRDQAKRMGLKVDGVNGRELYDGLLSTAKKIGTSLETIPDEFDIAGVKMTALDVVQLIFNITGDKNIIKLLNVGEFDDNTILDIATQYLLGSNELATKKILALFKKARLAPGMNDVMGVSLKTITRTNVKQGAPIVFFNSREGLYIKDELNRARANFMDKLAEGNKMKLGAMQDISDIQSEEQILEALEGLKGGYLVVNDSAYRDNVALRNALNKFNKELPSEEKITPLFPSSLMEGHFIVENGELYYKTVDADDFDKIAGTISLQTLGEANPTRELGALSAEAKTGKNADKLRYQASYEKGAVDNLGNQLSDQQEEYFRNSKARDENGNLKKFYHRTGNQFDSFSLDYFRRGSGDSLIPGFYFADQSASKIITNPKQANRLIEVYLNVVNPVNAWDGINKHFTKDEFIQLLRDYNLSIGRSFDEQRRAYKINERFDKDSTMEWMFHNIEGYEEIFGKQSDFMDYFMKRTGIDGVRDDEEGGVLIAFSPNQIKYTNNKVPSLSKDMRYQTVGGELGPVGLDEINKINNEIDRLRGERRNVDKAITNLDNKWMAEKGITLKDLGTSFDGTPSKYRKEFDLFHINGEASNLVEKREEISKEIQALQKRLAGKNQLFYQTAARDVPSESMLKDFAQKWLTSTDEGRELADYVGTYYGVDAKRYIKATLGPDTIYIEFKSPEGWDMVDSIAISDFDSLASKWGIVKDVVKENIAQRGNLEAEVSRLTNLLNDYYDTDNYESLIDSLMSIAQERPYMPSYGQMNITRDGAEAGTMILSMLLDYVNLDYELSLAAWYAGLGHRKSGSRNALFDVMKSLISIIGDTTRDGGGNMARAKGFVGYRVDDVLKARGRGGYSPREMSFITGKDGKITSALLGKQNSIGGDDIGRAFDKNLGNEGIFYHSHPTNGWFSGGEGRSGDLNTFSNMYTNGHKYNVGLINPGGIVFEFKNTPEFNKYADVSLNKVLSDATGWGGGGRTDVVTSGLICSLFTGEFKNQKRGDYQRIIDGVMDSYGTRLEKIIKDYRDKNIYKEEDRELVSRIGRIIREDSFKIDLASYTEKSGLDNAYIKNYKVSDVTDSIFGKLTEGQKNYGFNTVGEFIKKFKNLKGKIGEDKKSVLTFAYNASEQINNIGIKGTINAEDVFKRQYKGDNLMYVKVPVDSIHDEGKLLKDIVNVGDLGNLISPLKRRLEAGINEGWTMKDFFSSFVGGNIPGYYRIDDSIKDVVSEQLKELGIEGLVNKEGGLWLFDPANMKSVSNFNPKKTKSPFFQQGGEAGFGFASALEKDMLATNAIKLRLFKDGRTVKQIADAYGVDINVVESLLTPAGLKAYGAYGDGIINLATIIKESTAPHELFHAVFDMVDSKTRNKIIKKAQDLKLGKVMKKEFMTEQDEIDWINEMLADKFSEYFRTGNLNLNEFKKAFKEDKSIKEYILAFFEKVKNWINGVDEYKNDVKKMFDDMVNCKYIKNDGADVSQAEAMMKYNDELNQSAVNYYGQMLGVAGDVADKDYTSRVYSMLSDKTGIPIESFTATQTNPKLWQWVDSKFAIEKLTSGRFDKEFINIGDTLQSIDSLSKEGLGMAIEKDLKGLAKAGDIINNENFEHIKEAYKDYKTAKSETDSLTAKGKIISLANGGQAETLTIQRIKDMFTNGTFDETYRNLFFSNQKVDKKEMDKFVNAINDNIFDTISVGFADNLVDAGYALPLINVKEFVYDYLTGKVDINSPFIQSFFYKNNIPFTTDNIDAIVGALMPKEFKFDYIESLYKGRQYTTESGMASVFKEVDNRFLEDSYSALAAIENAKLGVSTTESSDTQLLTKILDKYIEEFRKGLQSGIDFRTAQGIKQEASYALDMFEQDILLPKYGKFLSGNEKKGLLGMKYKLPIAVSGQDVQKALDEMNNIRNTILSNYGRTIKQKSADNEINMAISKGMKGKDKDMEKKIAERKKQLIEQGATIKEINGEYVVYDVKKSLKDNINNLPKNIFGLEQLKAIGEKGIDELSNEQAYILLRHIEAAKSLNAMSNLATDLMYKQNPMLAKFNFFTAFKVENGLPKALKGNSLNGIDKLMNSAVVDVEVKKGVFKSIKDKFNKDGMLSVDDLKKIIDKQVNDKMEDMTGVLHLTSKETEEIRNTMRLVYNNAFTPYTYLRDIPSGGELMDGTKLVNVKQRVSDLMKGSYKQAMADLRAAGVSVDDTIADSILIRTADGEVKSLRELGDASVDSWKKNIFDDENVFVKAADKMKDFSIDPDKEMTEKARDRLVKQEKEYREDMSNMFNATLQGLLNGTQIISESEQQLHQAFMKTAREKLRKYTLTNQMVDTIDYLSGISQETSRGIQDYLIGLKGSLLPFGIGLDKKAVEKRLGDMKEAYKEFYYMPLESLATVKATTQAEKLARDLAIYFKELEKRLGSADGLTGCSTKADINRAFYHLGETLLNIKEADGVYSLLSAVQQNQIFKMFKFSKKGQPSYVEALVRKGSGVEERFGRLGGYRNYVEKIDGLTASEFNEMFGSQFDDDDFKIVLQSLTGFTLIGPRGRRIDKMFNLLSGSSWFSRFLMSYPGQLLTIPQQGAAYFLKQKGFEKELGIESMSDLDKVRETFGILDGAYNEVNVIKGIKDKILKFADSPDDVNPYSYYNRYGVPDTTRVYRGTDLQFTDDYVDIYGKVDRMGASREENISYWMRQMDSYKDNANNIVDGIFARNFKNIAFLKAIKENDFMQFADGKSFIEFMSDSSVSRETKSKLMDRVKVYSGRNFNNILGMGFGGIDRPIASSTAGQIFLGLMQLSNFRGAWGQNIFKQTGQAILTAIQMTKMGMSPEGKDTVARYLATSPEFQNFTGALFNDLMWSWKLVRFQDNGRFPDENEDEYSAMDFISFMTENMSMTSQRRQGIQSFGPARPVTSAVESVFQHIENPTVYKDTYGVGAFINGIQKNMLRQWKPANWMAKALGAMTTDGWDGFVNYVNNEFWKLSFGSLRYMMDEDMTSYGYNIELTGQVGGIPGIIMGESMASDKSFGYDIDNTETWETVKMLFDGNLSGDERWSYAGNLWKGFLNSSQFSGTFKNVIKAINRNAPHYYTSRDLAEVIQTTTAGKEFYSKGYVTPDNPEDAKRFFDSMLENGKYRPGSDSFNKSIMNFEALGHMNGKETPNDKDKEMELWLQHMKYQTNTRGEFVGDKKVDPQWEELIKEVKTHYNNQTYTTKLIYEYSKKWLNDHSADPNYQLYVKLLGQGQAYNVTQMIEDQAKALLNQGAGKGADNKWTNTEIENSRMYSVLLLKLGNYKFPGEDRTYFDKLQVLDQDASVLAALKIISNQATNIEDKKLLEKFFNVKKQDDGTESVSLSSQYKAQLLQMGAMQRALEDGNVERFLGEASSLTNMYMNDDPTGLVTASLLDSIYNRVYDTNSFTPKQKEEVMIALFHHNKEFIQTKADLMRDVMGDEYDKFANAMNQMLYEWDGKTISNLESIQTSGEKGTSSGGGSKGLSNLLKKLASKIGGDGYGGGHTTSTGNSKYKQRVPVTVKGADLVKDLGLKGYTPEITSRAQFKGYKPHADFNIGKDINRKVKKTQTQQISSKKQLSKAEEKVTKAMQAES